ncbi:MAG TPA: KH domain-containing protein [Ilumatobacteraceae bacterium]
MTDEPVEDRENEPIDPTPVEPEAVEPADLESPDLEPADVAAHVAATNGASDNGGAPTATAVLTHVVRSIVDDADAVRVDAVPGRNRLKLEVKVGPGDLGRVIGRRGRTAQSIRTVVRAAATRDGVEVDVDFVD